MDWSLIARSVRTALEAPPGQGAPHGRRGRVWAGLVGRAGVVLLLVGWLARRFDVGVVLHEWRGPVTPPIVFASMCFCAAMAVRVAKWAWQAQAMGWPPSWRLVRAYLWGILAGIVTPMRAGEAWRLGALGLVGRDAWLRGAAALVYEKGLELLGLLVIGLAGCVAIGAPWPWTLAVGVMAGVGAVALLTGVRLPAPARLDPAWQARVALAPARQLQIFALTVLAHLLNYAGIASLYAGFGDVAPARLLVGLPVVTLAAAVPVSLSGFGVREVVAAEVLGGTGVSPGAAALCATLGFVGANVLPSVLGLLLLPRKRNDVETSEPAPASVGACTPPASSSSAPTATSAGP